MSLKQTQKSGEIAFFNSVGEYGFITSAETEEDVFFHITDCEFETADVAEEDSVRFVVGADDKGPRAVEIELIDDQNNLDDEGDSV
jgi:CspA family cold shock protein